MFQFPHMQTPVEVKDRKTVGCFTFYQFTLTPTSVSSMLADARVPTDGSL